MHDGAPANGPRVSPRVVHREVPPGLPIPSESRRKTRTGGEGRGEEGRGRQRERRGRYLKGHDVIGRSRRVGVRGLNPRVLRESVSRVNIYIYIHISISNKRVTVDDGRASREWKEKILGRFLGRLVRTMTGAAGVAGDPRTKGKFSE